MIAIAPDGRQESPDFSAPRPDHSLIFNAGASSTMNSFRLTYPNSLHCSVALYANLHASLSKGPIGPFAVNEDPFLVALAARASALEPRFEPNRPISGLPPTCTSTKCPRHSVLVVESLTFVNTSMRVDFSPLRSVLGDVSPIARTARSAVWSGMPFCRTDTGRLRNL
jgi:hypothetical protein